MIILDKVYGSREVNQQVFVDLINSKEIQRFLMSIIIFWKKKKEAP